MWVEYYLISIYFTISKTFHQRVILMMVTFLHGVCLKLNFMLVTFPHGHLIKVGFLTGCCVAHFSSWTIHETWFEIEVCVGHFSPWTINESWFFN